MSKGMLLGGFIFLSVIALLIALYPLRRNKRMLCFMIPSLITLAIILYWCFGGWSLWSHYLQMTIKKQQVETMLQSVHGVDELIEKLKVKLDQNPKSARGWYLIGRLYAHQDQWTLANGAFKKAHDLKPKDVLITVNLAQSLLQLNHQVYNDKIRMLLQDMLQSNPNQPDAIAMLALDAYQAHAYSRAIEYWQRLLALAPPESDEANYIRKAINKARHAMDEQSK